MENEYKNFDTQILLDFIGGIGELGNRNLNLLNYYIDTNDII